MRVGRAGETRRRARVESDGDRRQRVESDGDRRHRAARPKTEETMDQVRVHARPHPPIDPSRSLAGRKCSEC